MQLSVSPIRPCQPAGSGWATTKMVRTDRDGCLGAADGRVGGWP
jgi:hypothetical protein